MILYSIVPPEVVFSENSEQGSCNNYSMDYMGEKVSATPILGGGFIITRVLSTSLKAYLDPKLQPGAKI